VGRCPVPIVCARRGKLALGEKNQGCNQRKRGSGQGTGGRNRNGGRRKHSISERRGTLIGAGVDAIKRSVAGKT